MIRELQIQGFKRFANQTFTLQPLTVLAGMNGTGKTSVVHALILAREAWRRGDGIVELNGPFGLELGGFDDVLNHETLGSFSIKILDNELNENELNEYEWTFSEGATELYATVVGPPKKFTPAFIGVARAFQYLSAERLGPRITLGSAALPPDLLETGSRGEYCAQLLDALGKTVIKDRRRGAVPGEDDLPLLKAQTEHWLSRVTRPVQIDTETFAGAAVTALKFRTGEDWVKPTNMGFGVTYALPVVLAGLTAGIGGLLMVENPEAHLRPAGQSQMGQEIDASWPTDFEVVVGEGPLEKAPSIAWAHAQASLGATSAVACIAHQLKRANGQVSVIVAEKTIPVWFVSNARDYKRFFRWLIVETTSSPDEMEELSASAFHSLDFVEGAFSGVKHMSKPYIDVAPAIVDHLAAFSDEGRRIFSGPGNRVAAEFGPFGVDISDESGRTKRNNKARAKRTVVVNGNARVFWWHSKLEPHQNRIYICPEKIREGGRILVGIFCNHL